MTDTGRRLRGVLGGYAAGRYGHADRAGLYRVETNRVVSDLGVHLDQLTLRGSTR